MRRTAALARAGQVFHLQMQKVCSRQCSAKELLMRCFPLETPASHCWISTEAKARVGAIAAKLLNPLSRHTCSPASCPNEPAKKNITEQPSSMVVQLLLETVFPRVQQQTVQMSLGRKTAQNNRQTVMTGRFNFVANGDDTNRLMLI